METQQTNGKAVAALVLGILSIVIPYVGLILGIIGIILANSSYKEIAVTHEGGRGLATAGLVTSIIGVALYGLLFIFIIFGIALFSVSYY
ncbi:DUF4190 domain-containing protein [Ornithinibacillus sp. BX22]|uniref:DUF4190 domain-containing protein n=2 Tax=Ornithinibacillus TaxID=484508 RepID=A0A923L4W2_9BACI|nr:MULTISPECIES: DUF4190 domain-containing protein [Ornithinibacillus]MBC5636538.1 DUF4190 domain-containing protein [Ornithinibacillus hominis]MBS3680620.1 DUF4190 domain-containing protein [Ornithinibacillus massiliensis]